MPYLSMFLLLFIFIIYFYLFYYLFLLFAIMCTQTTAIIGTLAAGAAIYWSEPWLFPLLIAIGFIITNITDRKEDRTLKVG